jgi:hypothetical protein
VDPRAGLDDVEKRKFLTLSGLELRPPGRPARRYTDYVTRAPWPCRSSAVRRCLPTAAARVCVREACGVCGGQSGTGAGFLRVLRFPLPIIRPISPSS